MKRYVFIAVLFLFVNQANAQRNRIDWDRAALGVDISARTLDAATTRFSLTHGGYEATLPPAIANHAATMEAYGLSVIAVEQYLSRRWLAPHHPKLSRFVPLIDAGCTFPFAIHNISQTKSTSTPTITLKLR